MTSPVLGTSAYSSSAGTTQHTVTLPTYNEGDLILIIATTVGGIPSAPTIDQGYINDGGQPNDTYNSTYVFSKVAGASEVAPVITHADNETIKTWAYPIPAATVAAVVGDVKTSSGNDRVDFPASNASADATILRVSHIAATTGITIDTTPSGTLFTDNLVSFGVWTQEQAAGVVAADELLFTENKRAAGLTVVIETTGGGGGSVSIESVGGDNSLQVGETGAITRLVNGDPASTVQSIDINGIAMPINGWAAE